MECHEVQLIVSEKCDDQPQSAELLAEAKAHCKSCDECASFVRSLARILELPAPPVPDGLELKIIEAVRAEAANAATEQANRESEEPPEFVLPAPAPVSSWTTLSSAVRSALDTPSRRRAAAIWGGAAAALLLVATVTAVSGIRAITGSPTEETALRAEQSPGSVMADMAAVAPKSDAAAESAAGTGSETTDNATQVISVSGVVYRFTGVVSGIASDTLSPVGSAMTALDSGNPAIARQVLGVNDPERVYVANDSGELLGFDRVARTYNGRAYVHATGELPAFGAWPTLPAGIEAPSSPNGMPGYVESGTDALGVRIFRPASGGPESGFLIAPGTAASDPAAGNPGWTWWVPAR